MIEALEVQKKAKQTARKAFRSYKESRRRVREIKKDRQPYMPVVAIPTGSNPTGESMPVQPTFKYDKKGEPRGDRKADGKGRRRKEEVNAVSSEFVSAFAYMVDYETTLEMPAAPEAECEVLTATIPVGNAVIDTGCTASVVGDETAKRFRDLFLDRGLPHPEEIELPTVQLKGFSGVRSSSSKGLRWTVKLGSVWAM